jgi:integrase
MSLYQRGETWWVYIVVNGQRIRQSTGQTDKREAQKTHDQIKYSAKQLKESGKTLNDALKLWLTSKPRSYKEKSAIKCYLKLYPSRPLSQINGHDILDALHEYSASHYNRTSNIIRAAVNLACERGWCESIDIPRRETPPVSIRFLSKAEWEKLEYRLAPHIKAMAQFSISTGLRQSNVLNLKWANVDLDRAVAWVESTEAKSKKPIPVPLSPYAVAILKAQEGKHEEFVFTYKNNPVGSVKKAWAGALERAGIKNFRWHDLRHTWASWHVMNGTPLAVLKELGGWSDISMVMRYAHLSPEHLRQYADNSVA